MRNVRNILAVSCGYAAAVIGAGFASGQEIVSFFLRYGKGSIIGIILSCVIFSLFSYAVMSRCIEKQINDYGGFLDSVFHGKFANKVIEYITIVFALCSLCVMTACAGEAGAVLFGVRNVYGAAVFAVMCGIIFAIDAKKMMQLNSLLGAVIIFGIIFSCIYILRFREHQVMSVSGKMVVSGAIYAGYNLLTSGAVLAGMSRFLKSKGEALISSLASGFILMIMITLIWGVIGIYYGKIQLGEIPMLTMTMRQNNMLGFLYGIMLIFAVVTTGVANGFVVMDTIGRKAGRGKTSALIAAVGFCMSGAGFSALVDSAYRVCGYAGLAVVCVIVIKIFKNMKNVTK